MAKELVLFHDNHFSRVIHFWMIRKYEKGRHHVIRRVCIGSSIHTNYCVDLANYSDEVRVGLIFLLSIFVGHNSTYLAKCFPQRKAAIPTSHMVMS